MYNNQNELMHYGILGMRWGVRRSTPSSSRAKAKTRGWSKEAKEAHNINRKSVKQMTNTELKKVNERTNLEQNYHRLNPNTINKGLAVVTATAGLMSTALNIYNNSDKIVKVGKRVVSKL